MQNLKKWDILGDFQTMCWCEISNEIFQVIFKHRVHVFITVFEDHKKSQFLSSFVLFDLPFWIAVYLKTLFKELIELIEELRIFIVGHFITQICHLECETRAWTAQSLPKDISLFIFKVVGQSPSLVKYVNEQYMCTYY